MSINQAVADPLACKFRARVLFTDDRALRLSQTVHTSLMLARIEFHRLT